MKHPKSKSLLLMAFMLMGCDEPQKPHARTSEHWEISAQYISNTMLKSNADIADDLEYKQIILLQSKDLPVNVFSRYRKMAKKMQLRVLPALYLDTTDHRSLPQALARFTREGRPYILINRGALSGWSPRQLVAVLGHELVHLKLNHVTAINLARAYNHPELSVAHELEADRIGSGPLGSCDPQALKEALEIVFGRDSASLVNDNIIASIDDYDSLTGNDHPNPHERLNALEAMAENLPPECK